MDLQPNFSSRQNGTPRNKKELRAVIVNNNNFKDKENQEWVLRTPYDIRDEGMNDVLKAYDSNFAKRNLNPEFKFEIKFRSKKKLHQESFVLHAKHLKLHLSKPLPSPELTGN